MIGIRHETKSAWETRTPLIPEDVRRLQQDQRLTMAVESSPRRAFSDQTYRDAGAAVSDNLQDCDIIIGIKEIPPELLLPGKVYLFFSHTAKGQAHNMPMLARLLELGCTLIDYERIVDEQGRRLVYFGNDAGRAGMIDTLWALGQRLQHEKIGNPFTQVQRAYEYGTLERARSALTQLSQVIRTEGLPKEIQPMIFGFAGYGNVSRGAQEILDLLPSQVVDARTLPDVSPQANTCYKAVFHEEHMVERVDGGAFCLQDYYAHPEQYRSCFYPQVRHLTVLVNCIYWTPRYPRLLTCEQVEELYSGEPPRLRVIGDITCDIRGSIECTVRATEPDDPVYVYDTVRGRALPGVQGNGPVILAVDILPCELPVDSSTFFSRSLAPFLAVVGNADFSRPLEHSGLTPELQRAAIVYRGQLTEGYRYLDAHLKKERN